MIPLSPFEHVVVGNVLVGVHRHGPSEPSIRAQLGALQTLAKERVSGVGYLLILQNGAMTPNAEARQEVTTVLDGLGGVLRVLAVVMEGGGFWASAVRSTLAVLLVARSRPYQVKIFAGHDEAIAWIARELQGVEGSATAATLSAAVARLRGEPTKEAPHHP